jgi:hypothetical protein
MRASDSNEKRISRSSHEHERMAPDDAQKTRKASSLRAQLPPENPRHHQRHTLGGLAEPCSALLLLLLSQYLFLLHQAKGLTARSVLNEYQCRPHKPTLSTRLPPTPHTAPPVVRHSSSTTATLLHCSSSSCCCLGARLGQQRAMLSRHLSSALCCV